MAGIKILGFKYRRAVEREIADSARITAELRERGEEIAAGTRANAVQSGYRDGVVVETSAGKVIVKTDWPFAHLDEWGSANNPASGAMRRAAESVGKFKEVGS